MFVHECKIKYYILSVIFSSSLVIKIHTLALNQSLFTKQTKKKRQILRPVLLKQARGIRKYHGVHKDKMKEKLLKILVEKIA